MFTGPLSGGAVRRFHARVNGVVTFFYAIGIELFNFSSRSGPHSDGRQKDRAQRHGFQGNNHNFLPGVVGTRPNVSTIDRLALTVHAYDHEVLAARAVCAVTETIRRRAEKEGA
jgi:hypothetical protein